MMKALTGKRLLILGGTTLMIHVVETAKRIGVFTIVTDASPSSPAKSHADKAYNISTNDISALFELARNEFVDGVFTGYDDFNTGIAAELCRALRLPFYATKEQIECTKDKIRFKELCVQHGVPVVEEYSIENIRFPCIIKPADSYSSKGITICMCEKNLSADIEYAREISPSNQYLIEKYMDAEKCACVNIDYVIRDGEIRLSAVGDKLIKKQGNKAPLTANVIYPSVYQDEYIKDVHDCVVDMFRALDMKNGVVFIESFYDDDGYHVYEMGFRLGGGQSSILLNRMVGSDYVSMLIHFALQGRMCDESAFQNITPYFKKHACGLVILIHPGTIGEIHGLQEVAQCDSVVNITQYYDVGNVIDSKLKGTLGQTFARIHIVADSREQMQADSEFIKTVLKVVDNTGAQMII